MFDDRLKKLRLEKGLNMKQTAMQLNIPYTTYVSYEKNEREPNSEVLLLLSNFFDCSTDYLIGRSTIRKIEETETLSTWGSPFKENTDKYNRPKTVSQKICMRRAELGLSAEDVANAVNIDKKELQMWENGITFSLNMTKLIQLAKVLQTEPFLLLTEEDNFKLSAADSGNPFKKEKNITRNELKLLEKFRTLNRAGKIKLIEYADDLTCNGKYCEKN